jgi:hypothetical protein
MQIVHCSFRTPFEKQLVHMSMSSAFGSLNFRFSLEKERKLTLSTEVNPKPSIDNTIFGLFSLAITVLMLFIKPLHRLNKFAFIDPCRLVYVMCVSSENFVSLAVYYGELKTETITQQPAYDVQTFFSE